MTTDATKPDPAELTDWLRDRVAFYLDQEPESIDSSVPLADYGMNSIYAVSVIADIEDHLGVEIDEMTAWRLPTIDDMVAHLTAEV